MYIQIINRIKNLPAVKNNPEAEQIQLELATMLFATGSYNITNTSARVADTVQASKPKIK